MTIFLYKGLTRNSENGNTPVWVLPNIWRLEWVSDTKFGTNVYIYRICRILQNARVTAFAVFELVREAQQGEGVKLPPPPPRSGLRSGKRGA